MKSAWSKKTIGELCANGGGKVQTGPFGSQLHQSDYSDNEDGTPVVMPADIPSGKIGVSRIARVSEAHVQRLARHQLEKGDIIYGRRGDIGRQALVREENVGWLCGTGCLRIRLGKSDVDSEYLHRYLTMPEIVGWIEGQAIGATMPNLNTDILNRVPIYFPPLPTQRKIAAILTAYDDLIETNKQRIALLEKMAEELYREWFVRMRFPGHENTRFVKGVPEGWTVKRISDVYQTASGGTPSRKSPEYFSGDIQWLKTGELKDLFTPDSEEKITQSALESSAARLFPASTVIMAMYCAMPDISIATYDCATNQACCAFLPKFDWLHYGYNYFVLRDAQKQLVMFAHGAAQQNLSQEIIRKFQVLLPNKTLIEEFGRNVEPLLLMIRELSDSIRILTKTRDLLLPRLISGKLSVENLDIQFPPGMQEETPEPESAYAELHL